MLNEHAKFGIATIVFYIRAVVMSAYLLFHRHRRPRIAWYFRCTFSLGMSTLIGEPPSLAGNGAIRLANGVVVKFYERKPKEIGLLIAAIILLGVGVMRLIGITIGMIRIT